jgi:methylmalonyl-CoA mutase N-terminal domain/subunit
VQGFPLQKKVTKDIIFLLAQGVMGLSVAFDLPTQIGYDADHDLADGEVGKSGCINLFIKRYGDFYLRISR